MQTFLQNLTALFKKHRQTIAIAIIAALSVYNLWQTQISSPQPDTLARPTAIKPTATPRPPRQTLTPLPPTLTLTASPTLLITATPELTATPVTLDPCSNWHPYGLDLRYPNLGMFDYGVNPCAYIPVFGAILENYLIEQNVDGFPRSSTMEEQDGYTWLYVRVAADGTQDQQVTPGAGCALFVNVPENLPEDALCLTNVLTRQHNRGDGAHSKKRFHSVIVFGRVCAVKDGKPVEPCGTLGTAGLEDWGVKHTPYKNQLCYDETTPKHFETGALYPFDLIGQPPYVAFQPARNGFAHQFISTITFNKVVEPYYMTEAPEFPNHIIRLSWNMLDAPEVFVCGDEPIPTGYKGVKFALHAVVLANLPTDRPFSGFTTKNGYLQTNCTVFDYVCFPLWIDKDVPLGTPFLSYPVQFDTKQADGTWTGVIIQDFSP